MELQGTYRFNLKEQPQMFTRSLIILVWITFIGLPLGLFSFGLIRFGVSGLARKLKPTNFGKDLAP